jgi:hypothetical protein
MTPNSVALVSGRILIGIFVLTVLAGANVAATPTFEPVYNPLLQTARVTEAIEIDGDLTDAGWKRAGRAHQFVESFPGDNVEPAVQTYSYIAYDQDNLYIAFVCKDDPKSIRATMCQRDQFFGDDAVGVMIDTNVKRPGRISSTSTRMASRKIISGPAFGVKTEVTTLSGNQRLRSPIPVTRSRWQSRLLRSAFPVAKNRPGK